MAIEIKMPALSPTMTTGTLAKWLVGEGDRVNSGDVIAEIETSLAITASLLLAQNRVTRWLRVCA